VGTVVHVDRALNVSRGCFDRDDYFFAPVAKDYFPADLSRAPDRAHYVGPLVGADEVADNLASRKHNGPNL
jgi:hypothetical protein